MGQRKANFIGLDIGGTKMEGILWRGGKIVSTMQIRTPRTRPVFLRALLKLVSFLGMSGVRGVGLSVAGAIDLRQGKILSSPNLRFLKNFGLRDWVAKRLKTAVRIDNDANCFLRGELMFGRARGKKHVVILTLGTGVGGGVAIDGKLLSGHQVSAAELGHIVLSREGGRFLTLEDLVSSHGFRRFGIADPLALQNKGFAGDKKAIAIYRQIGTYLGAGLASLINIFDPELVILGGGISRADYLLLRPALREMPKHTLHSLKVLPPVKISKLKHAGALGAVTLFSAK